MTFPEATQLLSNAGDYLMLRAQYEQAEPLFERALAIRERVLGPDHPDAARSLIWLATSYEDRGKYEQAEPLFERALAIREHVLGPDHPDTALSLTGLATLYMIRGKLLRAIKLRFPQILAIFKKSKS